METHFPDFNKFLKLCKKEEMVGNSANKRFQNYFSITFPTS